WSEAAEAFRRVLALKADHFEAWNNLGTVLKAMEKFDDAIVAYRRALALRSDVAAIHSNLANAIAASGQWADAIVEFRQALSLEPANWAVMLALGTALQASGDLNEAIGTYRQILALRPDSGEASARLADALRLAGQLDEACMACRQAVALMPDSPAAHNTMGLIYHDQGRMEEAVAEYHQALKLKPDDANAFYNLGNVLLVMGRLENAAAAFGQAISHRPDFFMAHTNLGNAAKDLGQLDQAIDCYRKAITLKPSFEQVHSSLIYTLHFHQDYDAQAILREHRIWNQTHAQPLQQHVQPHTNDRSPDRRLKIGYVSPDFRDHCQCFFTDPLLSRHDKRQFEIFCYSGVLLEDAVTKRLRGYADHWHSTVSLSDEKLADAIRADGIDVLVDLTMHMTRSRILAFVYRPAPVQVSWLAYPSTTGVDAIDYRLTDPHLDPPGMYDQDYSEKSVRLPDTFWCYDLSVVGLGDGQGPGVGPLPALQNGFVTFGCLNNFCKVTQRALSLWAQTMAAVPKSRLILLTREGSARQRVLDQLAAGGVTADRVEFVGYQRRDLYLQTYHRIDLGLDTLPYNGHTTSLDAMWMGVPVITLVGATAVGRAGFSQLSNLGLQTLVANTQEQFVRIAATLANDLPRLAELRASMRQRMQQSPLTDAKRFARNVESAYRQMWRTWCQTR
ncbi:MAG: tetratricopeptide repeat protein, partial [Tepidisphaeraceae bacterium]